MPEWLLTDEEIENRLSKFLDDHPYAQWDSDMAFRDRFCSIDVDMILYAQKAG